jgi:hypothetical protein
VVNGSLPTVHTARLQLRHQGVARKILSRLTEVIYLDLYSRDATMWPPLLEDWPRVRNPDVTVSLYGRPEFQHLLQSKFGSLVSICDSAPLEAPRVVPAEFRELEELDWNALVQKYHPISLLPTWTVILGVIPLFSFLWIWNSPMWILIVVGTGSCCFCTMSF